MFSENPLDGQRVFKKHRSDFKNLCKMKGQALAPQSLAVHFSQISEIRSMENQKPVQRVF